MIRKATPADRMDFSFLANQFIKESKYPFRVDWDLLLSNYELALNNQEFLVLLLVEDSRPVGMLVGGVSSPLFSKDRVATELAWFVEKDFRKSKGSLSLLSKYEAWAKERGCSFVTMVDIDTLSDLSSLYTRKGYILTEKTYVKEL